MKTVLAWNGAMCDGRTLKCDKTQNKQNLFVHAIFTNKKNQKPLESFQMGKKRNFGKIESK